MKLKTLKRDAEEGHDEDDEFLINSSRSSIRGVHYVVCPLTAAPFLSLSLFSNLHLSLFIATIVSWPWGGQSSAAVYSVKLPFWQLL